ncbi:MAG: hypothetical protein KGJ62_13545 [Armatimonadetes bacterium]|nr:hypothetical protein [Armatimonadota bacterium]MDE2206202.1 hypothetical protein [Armatimonadota bacterium]
MTPPTDELSRTTRRKTDRIGAVVLIAVLVTGAVGVTVARRAMPPTVAPHLVSPQQRAQALQDASDMAAPDPNWLMRNTARFGVTKAQFVRVKAAADLYNVTMRNAQAERTRLAADLNGVAKKDPNGGHRVLATMRDRELIMMTEATFSMARNTWWQRVTPVLSPAQVKSISDAWYAYYVMGPTAVRIEQRARRITRERLPPTAPAQKPGS